MAGIKKAPSKLSQLVNVVLGIKHNTESIPSPEAYSSWRTLGNVSWNGEKNLGEIGPIKNYYNDYEALRTRSWQLYTESEIVQIIINKFKRWTIGSGLKLQAEPVKRILQKYNKSFKIQDFCEDVEARFGVYAASKKSDYANMSNLNTIEGEAFKNAKISGDVLVILRYIDDSVKVQLIDGVHVRSTFLGNEYWPQALANGNRIIDGIEVSPTGEHVAYYVRKYPYNLYTFEFDRIPARGEKSGMLMAFMVYGTKQRLDNFRGLPLLSVIMETSKKLERYKEATIGKAEENAKIAYTIEHDVTSTGENPLIERGVRAYDLNRSMSSDIPQDDAGNIIANKFTATTGKQIFNMPIGSKIKTVDNKGELYFKEFYEVLLVLCTATADMPYEVAVSKYDSNYSASRAALKDWEHSLHVNRKDFSFQFKKPIYEFWLEMQILTNKISAPGYMKAKADNDFITIEAYCNSRWEGVPVPHIDPFKEVQAERAKLGPLGANIPLTTAEASTALLAGGDSDANIEQFSEELKMAKKFGLNMDPIPTATPSDPSGKTSKKKKKASP